MFCTKRRSGYNRQTLRNLINCSFLEGSCPSILTDIIIKSIHTKGDIHDMTQYRGSIALLSPSQKCLRRLSTTIFLEEQNFFTRFHFRFLKGLSTQGAMVDLYNKELESPLLVFFRFKKSLLGIECGITSS